MIPKFPDSEAFVPRLSCSIIFIVFSLVPFFNPTLQLFLTATWLSHGQLWAVLEGAASLTRCSSLSFLEFWPEGHREPHNEVGSLSLAESLVGFEPGIFRFQLQRFNPLCHSPQRSLAKSENEGNWNYNKSGWFEFNVYGR